MRLAQVLGSRDEGAEIWNPERRGRCGTLGDTGSEAPEWTSRGLSVPLGSEVGRDSQEDHSRTGLRGTSSGSDGVRAPPLTYFRCARHAERRGFDSPALGSGCGFAVPAVTLSFGPSRPAAGQNAAGLRGLRCQLRSD